MSIITGARTYADTVVEQGKSTITLTQGRLLSATSDATERATSLVGETKELALGAVTFARRQAFATIGAGDAIVASLTKRTSELPGEAKQGASRVIDTTTSSLDKASTVAGKFQSSVAAAASDIRERGVDAVGALRSLDLAGTVLGARGAVDGQAAQVKDAFGKLADRGEQVAADLRHDPLLVRVITDADTGVAKAANQVTSVAQKLRTRAVTQAEQETSTVTSTPVRPTAAKRIPSHKTTARKTPANEAAVSTVPTYRAAAQETAIRKEAARKAAATRKADAAEAAATRKAATAKAAATRKATAAAREEATATRKAAGVKAAATRKANAKKAAAVSTVS